MHQKVLSASLNSPWSSSRQRPDVIFCCSPSPALPAQNALICQTGGKETGFLSSKLAAAYGQIVLSLRTFVRFSARSFEKRSNTTVVSPFRPTLAGLPKMRPNVVVRTERRPLGHGQQATTNTATAAFPNPKQKKRASALFLARASQGRSRTTTRIGL